MDYINDNLINCLKQEIDSYREKYAISQQEIKELKKENKGLMDELLEDGINYKRMDKLKAENESLKEQVNDLMIDLKQAIQLRDKFGNERDNYYDEIKELKDKLQAVNDDYNNDHKVHNEYEDGLLEEIKELKAKIIKLEVYVDKYGAIAYDELKKENDALKDELNKARCGGVNQ